MVPFEPPGNVLDIPRWLGDSKRLQKGVVPLCGLWGILVPPSIETLTARGNRRDLTHPERDQLKLMGARWAPFATTFPHDHSDALQASTEAKRLHKLVGQRGCMSHTSNSDSESMGKGVDGVRLPSFDGENLCLPVML